MFRFSAFIADEAGVTAIEYALIGALIAVVIIAGLGLVSADVADLFNRIETAYPKNS